MAQMSREWSMPNHNTFQMIPVRNLLRKYLKGVIVDPFARNSKAATITNDLNPNTTAMYHMDAVDFLETLQENSADCVLYDPPYSSRQVSECYQGVGKQVTAIDTSARWRKQHLDEIKRILKPDGILISFGWNSAGAGKGRGFKMVEILLVAHGGSKNDTICTVEVKTENKYGADKMEGQITLEAFEKFEYAGQGIEPDVEHLKSGAPAESLDL